MNVTLTFDPDRVFGTANAPAMVRFLKGEISMYECAKLTGWSAAQWQHMVAMIFMRAVGNAHPSIAVAFDETRLTVHGHTHGEAFCAMKYRCEHCGREEWLWNSRDGVTPFCISCPECARVTRDVVMRHIDWHLDRYQPNRLIARGERFFRDGTIDEAREIARARIDMCKGTRYEVPAADVDEAVERIANATDGEFQRGWPRIDVGK